MQRIIDIKKAIKISKKLKQEGKKIVLCGGCFDVLHIGHIRFLDAAKKEGDILFVLLENDTSVKKLKGEERPINTQEERAILLSSLRPVDYVVILPDMNTNTDYDKLVLSLKPDIIAATKDAEQSIHIKRTAKLAGAEPAFVVNRISNRSTTRLAKLIEENNRI